MIIDFAALSLLQTRHSYLAVMKDLTAATPMKMPSRRIKKLLSTLGRNWEAGVAKLSVILFFQSTRFAEGKQCEDSSVFLGQLLITDCLHIDARL